MLSARKGRRRIYNWELNWRRAERWNEGSVSRQEELAALLFFFLFCLLLHSTEQLQQRRQVARYLSMDAPFTLHISLRFTHTHSYSHLCSPTLSRTHTQNTLTHARAHTHAHSHCCVFSLIHQNPPRWQRSTLSTNPRQLLLRPLRCQKTGWMKNQLLSVVMVGMAWHR